MKAKITKSLTLNTLIPDIKKSFVSDKVKKAIREEVIDHINSGKSPVAGKRFKNYSAEYAKLKGRKRPVDMLVTGKMLRSLQIRKTKTSFILAFTDKVAKFHNETGRVIRRLLPTKSGERFARGIEKLILKSAELAAKGAVNKQNRR